MPARKPILILFFLSGATALLYQVLWSRLLTLVFGSTTFAVSAVLTAFMVGLALGAFLFGRFADRLDRPLRLYASLELGIALAALVIPGLIEHLSAIYPALHAASQDSPWVLPLARLLLSLLILTFPCLLMGGTLPVLVRVAARAPERFGRDFGLLYGMNTLGAVAGALAGGFWLIGHFGVSATNRLAIGINFALALAFFLLDRRLGRLPSPPEAPELERQGSSTSEKLVILVAVFSGFTILGLEVLWTRALVQAFWSTTYSFTAVLAAVLLALASGSFLAARFPVVAGRDLERRLLGRLAWVELLFALSLLLALPLLGQIAVLNDFFAERLGEPWLPAAKFITAMLLLYLPASVAGMLFPLSIQVLSRQLHRVGTSLGRVYLFNTLASALGTLMVGFVLIPTFGVTHSYLGFLLVHGLIASGLGFHQFRRPLWLVATPLLAVLAILGLRLVDRPDLFGDPLLRAEALRMELLEYREATDATFAIYESKANGDRLLYINGFVAAANDFMGQYMPMMAHLPLLLHGDPRRVLVIAFGTGSTAGAASLHPIERLDIVDISREPFVLAPYFAATNHHVLKDPRTRAIVEDGRNYVEATAESYDIITSEPMPPKFSGMVNFYTRDYYETARRHLNPGGVLCQWLPFHLMSLEDAKMIVRAFLAVFPEAQLWSFRKTGLLIGSTGPVPFDAEAMARRIATSPLREELARLDYPSLDSLRERFALDAQGLAIFAQGAPMLTDDTPYMEFSGDLPKHQLDREQAAIAEIRRINTQRYGP